MLSATDNDPWDGLTRIDEGIGIFYPKIDKEISLQDLTALSEYPNIDELEVLDPPLLVVTPQSRSGFGVKYIGQTPLKKGQFLCFYKGVICSRWTIRQQEQTGRRSRYLVQVNPKKGIYIDSQHWRNIAGFINHSHEPNCDLGIESWKGLQVAVIRATREIVPNEFLGLDYGWISNDDNELKEPCFCGASSCTGFLFRPSLYKIVSSELQK